MGARLGTPRCRPRSPAWSELVLAGGFAGTVAQATLEAFAVTTPDPVRDALARALSDDRPAEPRARLVETLGLVPGAATTRILLDLALDADEPPAVRAAALAALGDLGGPVGRRRPRATLDLVARTGGPLGAVASLARADLDASRRRSDRA